MIMYRRARMTALRDANLKTAVTTTATESIIDDVELLSVGIVGDAEDVAVELELTTASEAGSDDTAVDDNGPRDLVLLVAAHDSPVKVTRLPRRVRFDATALSIVCTFGKSDPPALLLESTCIAFADPGDQYLEDQRMIRNILRMRFGSAPMDDGLVGQERTPQAQA